MTTVIAESLSADSLDLETLLELSRRSDPVGVLSVYLDARPGESAQAATIDLKNRLAELERRLANDEPPELARAVHDAIARLAGEIGRLIDPEHVVEDASCSPPSMTHGSRGSQLRWPCPTESCSSAARSSIPC